MPYPLIVFPLTTKYMTWNDLEWPFYDKCSLLRTTFRQLSYIYSVADLAFLTRGQLTDKRGPPLPSPPFPYLSPSLPFEVGPLNPARGSGERCKLPQWGLGRSSRRNRFLVHFSPKIRHLVAKCLMIFLRINLPNFMYFEVYQTWTGGDGNCFLGGPIILQVMLNS